MEFMNILLPIIINLITLGAIIIGAIIGQKNGWRYEILKLFTFCAIGAGIYFLVPILHNFINIEPKLMFSILLMIFLILIEIIFALIKAKNDKAKILEIKTVELINTAKPLKGAKNLNLLKQRIKEVVKTPKFSKFTGAIVGIIVSIVTIFIIYIPIRPMLIDYCNDNNIDTLKYTLVEQIENTNVEDLLTNLAIEEEKSNEI